MRRRKVGIDEVLSYTEEESGIERSCVIPRRIVSAATPGGSGRQAGREKNLVHTGCKSHPVRTRLRYATRGRGADLTAGPHCARTGAQPCLVLGWACASDLHARLRGSYLLISARSRFPKVFPLRHSPLRSRRRLSHLEPICRYYPLLRVGGRRAAVCL